MGADSTSIHRLVAAQPSCLDKLYACGFLLTDAEFDVNGIPPFASWREEAMGEARLFVHPRLPWSSVKCRGGGRLIILGHAYDPVSGLALNDDVVSSLGTLDFGSPEFYGRLNELTGVFTLVRVGDFGADVIGDPTCMQSTFYALIDGRYWVSSHSNAIGDVLGLDWDPYVRELVGYRHFKLLGNSLPGDLSQFAEVKRLVPNHVVSLGGAGVSVRRFFTPHRENLPVEDIASKVASLIHANLKLITEKWPRPAISMTGGCDSKTTLSCLFADGEEHLERRFSYFSYISSDAERVDAWAAHAMLGALGLAHRIDTIPDEVDDFCQTRQLLDWNGGSFGFVNDNDIRKRSYYAEWCDFDVEVKSWASEIGRSYYSKRFAGLSGFGAAPSPRKCTTMYKFFLGNRALVKKTDKVFKAYLDAFFQQDAENPIAWQEQFFWEHRVPSWNGLVITGEHRYSFDITIPYNNRLILNMLVSAPADARLNDTVYKIIRAARNPAIDEAYPTVQNLHHTSRRAKFERLYYSVHSRLPF